MNRQKIKFNGHQTFPFRYGWLEKGYMFKITKHEFNETSAIVDLGVGKNMVESIKYWCEMTGIMLEGRISNFGHFLLNEEIGADPFLEDNASLWLLHWKLTTNPNYLTAGSVMFSFLHKPEFSKRDIAEAIARQLDRSTTPPPSDNVILRDVDCYTRLYAGTRRFEKSKNIEETFDCPLQELGLISPMTDAEMYRFAIGPKISLPAEIIGFAIWEYLNRDTKRTTMRIQEALYHEYSPGQVFMLDENTLIEAINNLNATPEWGDKFSFTESAGIALIHCTMDDGIDLLHYYYTIKNSQGNE